jgi:hypothetical protein
LHAAPGRRFNPGMEVYVAYKRYFDAAKAAETPTWRTVYLLGLMCATAVNQDDFIAFVGNAGYAADWPDPRLYGSSSPVQGKTD